MAFLHTHSCECVKSELDLFSVPPTQATIENSHWIHYKPISSLTRNSPIEFHVPGNNDEYLDLAHTMLRIKAKIVNDSPITADNQAGAALVGPVNNFLHSIFSQVDVSLNQKLVSPTSNNYAYRAYIETLLNYSEEAKKSHLGTVLWCDDTAGSMDNTSDGNEGLIARRNLMKEKSVDMMGHLHVDIFNQEKLLINGVEIRVKLVKSREGFSIMDPTGIFDVEINDATLLIRRVRISPSVLIYHAKMLATTTAKYNITRVEVKTVALHQNIQGESMDNIILGQLPKRLIIGFVSHRAFNGARNLNPFNFHHYTLNYLSLYVDGVQIPSKPLQPDYMNCMYIDCYHTLFSGTGIHFLNQGNSISRSDYPLGYCLYAFDLTPDLSANDDTHFNLVRHGSVRLEVRFSSVLPETVNCVIYAEYDTILEIDQSRQVTID